MKLIFNWIKSHQFAVFLMVVVIITTIMTISSLVIYRTSGAYQFDLSRPGYENVRDSVKNDDTYTPFPSEGPLDATATKDFLERFDRLTERLDKMNDYDAEMLDDENLGLIPLENTDDSAGNLDN